MGDLVSKTKVMGGGEGWGGERDGVGWGGVGARDGSINKSTYQASMRTCVRVPAPYMGMAVCTPVTPVWWRWRPEDHRGSLGTSLVSDSAQDHGSNQ